VASVVADVFYQRQCHDQQDTQDSQVIEVLLTASRSIRRSTNAAG
jgi:hypothetical protein